MKEFLENIISTEYTLPRGKPRKVSDVFIYVFIYLFIRRIKEALPRSSNWSFQEHNKLLILNKTQRGNLGPNQETQGKPLLDPSPYYRVGRDGP